MIGIIISKNLRADYSSQRRINEKSFLEESFLKFFFGHLFANRIPCYTL